jgi:hypothetical protein
MTPKDDSQAASQGMTDLEREVASNEKTEGDGSGGEDVRVARRHGIWTVSKAGVFVGDYHDPDAAMAAAAQAHHHEDDGDGNGELADPWQRSGEDAGR